MLPVGFLNTLLTHPLGESVVWFYQWQGGYELYENERTA